MFYKLKIYVFKKPFIKYKVYVDKELLADLITKLKDKEPFIKLGNYIINTENIRCIKYKEMKRK